MKDVIARIARLRELQARMAQAERAKAQLHLDEAVQVESSWREQLMDANTSAALLGGDAVGRGHFALNGEMRRRQAQGEVDRLQGVLDQHTEQVMLREREQKVAERLVERRQARRRAEAQRKEQAELDELARNGWFRRET